MAEPETVWQGRVFLNHVQVLRHIDKKDPFAGDCFLPDNKGNHMEWFISASAISAATNRPRETLQGCYSQFGSSARSWQPAVKSNFMPLVGTFKVNP